MRKHSLLNAAICSLALASMVFALIGCDGSKGKKEVTEDIIEIATADGSCNTLVTAIEAADLTETLKGEGPFTVFAPNDEAFAKLPEGTLDTLLLPENKEKLAGILTFHIVPEELMSAQVLEMTKANTVNGKILQIKTEGGDVMVDGAKVIKTDIICSNGVIHIIDTVAMPK